MATKIRVITKQGIARKMELRTAPEGEMLDPAGLLDWVRRNNPNGAICGHGGSGQSVVVLTEEVLFIESVSDARWGVMPDIERI